MKKVIKYLLSLILLFGLLSCENNKKTINSLKWEKGLLKLNYAFYDNKGLLILKAEKNTM